MTSQEFVAWLKGYISGVESVVEKPALRDIKKQLELVQSDVVSLSEIRKLFGEDDEDFPYLISQNSNTTNG